MFKNLLWTLAFLCMLTSSSFAQSVDLSTFSVSPAQIKADTVGNVDYIGLLDRVYTGLLNVGVEQKMVLTGTSDVALAGATWNVLEAPTNSTASVMHVTEMDSASQMATFTPDLEGKYVIEFANEGATATITLNAGMYVGVGDEGGCSNAFCHTDKVADWMATDHSSMLDRSLDGKNGSYYSESCISCHTVGYDTSAANGGFDDWEFVFPTELKAGMADSLREKFPDAMHFANIQCESCHGPASAHNGNTSDNRMVASMDAGVCASCHDDDHYHVYPSQWKTAGHANLPSYPGGSRTDCRGCHNGAQFVQYIEGEEITKQPSIDVTCATCHDPHQSFGDTPDSDNGRFQIRTVEATLSNGKMVTEGGNGILCMNCHQSRREANSYTDKPQSHFGPHYGPQADMLHATNAITFGRKLPTSAHLSATENSCVDCHMYEKGSHGEHDEDGDLNTAGMHSFSMVSKKGVDNVSACVDCHGDVGSTFDEKKLYLNGIADHDGDGSEEGLQEEVHGLMETLAEMLPHADSVDAYDPHDEVDDTWTRTELKAAFNLQMVYYDHSYGIHNPAFTVSLLKVSMQALKDNAVDGEIVAIDDVPNDQGRHVKIIWDKMVGDGVSADPVETYKVKRYDSYDDTWTDVGEVTADGSKRYAIIVPTVFDSTSSNDGMTSFKVSAITMSGNVHESTEAHGYSVDNLIPMAPVNLAALVDAGDVKLTWEATADPDINYYRIFRSTTEGFIPDESTAIGSTIELEFADPNVADGSYYYKVLAVDFSGNMGEPSIEVSASITAIDGNNRVPLDFELTQNYPNPFNPHTTIQFSLKNSGKVSLVVYNTLGQEVQTLINHELGIGSYSVTFNGSNLSSGVYVYKILVTNSGESGIQFQAIRKMILMK